ncbi:MAG: hypothetical protein RL441_237 [Actinomycetota bacterium]|jgi:hypothetical protein
MSEYLRIREALEVAAEAHPNAVAFVWAGSAADTQRIDAWSDHDFFLIVEDGFAEPMRADLSWLPLQDEIAWAVRETDHGYKVVYNNGQVLEFAVFDRSELSKSRINHFALTFDRAEIAAVLECVYSPAPTSRYAAADNLEIFMTLLILGGGRARRGEILSAGQFIRSYAVDHLLQAIKKTRESSKPAARDGLDVYRRVEQEFESLGTEVGRAIAQDCESSAKALLAIAEREFGTEFESVRKGAPIVRTHFGWN